MDKQKRVDTALRKTFDGRRQTEIEKKEHSQLQLTRMIDTLSINSKVKVFFEDGGLIRYLIGDVQEKRCFGGSGPLSHLHLSNVQSERALTEAVVQRIFIKRSRFSGQQLGGSDQKIWRVLSSTISARPLLDIKIISHRTLREGLV